MNNTSIPKAVLVGVLSIGLVTSISAVAGASFSYEKMQALGGAAAALAGELIGITAVKKGCFK